MFFKFFTNSLDENRIPKLVWIRHVSNGLISLTEIYTHQNVIDLKLWIRQHAGVPPHRGINMFFNDTQLNNDDEFEDIGKLSHLYLTVVIIVVLSMVIDTICFMFFKEIDRTKRLKNNCVSTKPRYEYLNRHVLLNL